MKCYKCEAELENKPEKVRESVFIEQINTTITYLVDAFRCYRCGERTITPTTFKDVTDWIQSEIKRIKADKVIPIIIPDTDKEQ